MLGVKDAQAILTACEQLEKKNGRDLVFNLHTAWAYCPTCGDSMFDAGYSFVQTEGKNPVTGGVGIIFIFYIRHASKKRTCVWINGGIPEGGGTKEQLLGLGDAWQTLHAEMQQRRGA